MIKSVFLDCSIWSKAKSIALIPAEKIEALFGNRHLYVSDGVTQADPAVSSSFDPSVNIVSYLGKSDMEFNSKNKRIGLRLFVIM